MEEATKIWQQFVTLPGAVVDGNVGIASQFAIGGLIKVLLRYQPHRILEIGSGIGTLTYTMLQTIRALKIHQSEDFAFYTVENEPFCIDQLGHNLQTFAADYTLFSSTSVLPALEQAFDLIVVDGGGDLPNDMGVMRFDNLLSRGGCIFVEGNRSFQRQKIMQWYGKRPYLYTRMVASQQIVISQSTGQTAKNKSYHLFLFEPEPMDQIYWRTVGLVNNMAARLRRRISSN